MKNIAIESSPGFALIESSWREAVNQVIEDNLMRLFNELAAEEFHLTAN